MASLRLKISRPSYNEKTGSARCRNRKSPGSWNKIWRRTESVHFACYDKRAEDPSTKHRPGRNALYLSRCFMQHHKKMFVSGALLSCLPGFDKKQRIRPDRHRVSTLRDMIGTGIRVLQRGGNYRAGSPKTWRCQRSV